MGLFYHVLVYMGDLHLVNPAMTLSILDTDILIMVQQVSLMMFSLNTLDYPMSLTLKIPGPHFPTNYRVNANWHEGFNGIFCSLFAFSESSC